MSKGGTQLQWFFEKVEQRGLDECWNWKAGKTWFGHGVFGKGMRAHRWIWEFENGPIPKGMVVRHKCDNPGCVNPYHLELGTHQDNMRDRCSRGRTQHGEKAGPAKLSNADVVRVREASLFGARRVELAGVYGVTPEAISAVVLGRSHIHSFGDANGSTIS